MTTPGTLYRLASGAAATPATSTNSPYGQPAKPYAAGSIQNGSERNRILELLRAPNSLTSPTLEPSSKGLLNGPGQNNCFLNCAVQA
ncbi:GM12309 [Drosophila sechellia]|uniref:GM12309 n=1 Tax=Drosophila sechellia TaxID=7238 RepID=B4I149_DROSE|nr:GM12309 [Drosophila sechellia]